jgi:hypothetical protein
VSSVEIFNPPLFWSFVTVVGLQVSDGSSLSGLQVVVNAGVSGHQQLVEGRINTGAAVSARGTLVQSPGGKQSVSNFLSLSTAHLRQRTCGPHLAGAAESLASSSAALGSSFPRKIAQFPQPNYNNLFIYLLPSK